jgi:DNA-binding XRE family transcriptional regulator
MPNTRPKRTPFTDVRVDYTKLRRVRRAKFEMSMKDLARAVGVHPSTIYRLEKNDLRTSHLLVLALGRALGVPHTDLFEILPPEPDARV